MVWSFFGLLASGLIAGYQKYDNLAKEEAKRRKEEYLAGLEKSYYTVLDTAVNDYINNACDLKLQEEIRKDLFKNESFLKRKYKSEWDEVVKNFDCYTKTLNGRTNQIEEYDDYNGYWSRRWEEPDPQQITTLMKFFMAKHGKDYVFNKEDIKEMFMRGSFAEIYNKRLEWEKYVPDFDTCFLEWKLKTLKENGFPYTFRFVEHKDRDFCGTRHIVNIGMTTVIFKQEMLEYIEKNSSVGFPENLGCKSGFILLDEFKGFHLWGERLPKGDDFYKIT